MDENTKITEWLKTLTDNEVFSIAESWTGTVSDGNYFQFGDPEADLVHEYATSDIVAKNPNITVNQLKEWWENTIS